MVISKCQSDWLIQDLKKYGAKYMLKFYGN